MGRRVYWYPRFSPERTVIKFLTEILYKQNYLADLIMMHAISLLGRFHPFIGHEGP
jgi:hypothetical protein